MGNMKRRIIGVCIAFAFAFAFALVIGCGTAQAAEMPAFSDKSLFYVGGQNILDNYPDRSIDDIAYFGNLPYDVLSPIGSNGAYWYGRVRYSF